MINKHKNKSRLLVEKNDVKKCVTIDDFEKALSLKFSIDYNLTPRGYIFPNGKNLALDSYTSHGQVLQFLIKNGCVEEYEGIYTGGCPPLEDLGCIRTNLDSEGFVMLSVKEPTAKQYEVLLDFFDKYLDRKHQWRYSSDLMILTPHQKSDFAKISLTNKVSDDIVDIIRNYYRTGRIVESKKIENLTNIEAMYLLEREEEEVLKEEKIETDRFDVFVFESPYQVKNKLLSSNESFRIFIDEKTSLYLLGLPYDTTHTEMVDVANENGFNTSIDDFNKNKLCAVFVPYEDEEYGYMAEPSLASDDYDTVYEYDNFKVYSRYQDFSKFKLASILGKYTKRKLSHKVHEELESSIDRNINEELLKTDDPKKLLKACGKYVYHATYKKHLDNIKKNGLSNFWFGIYADECLEMIEFNHGEYEEEIVIKIPTKLLNADKCDFTLDNGDGWSDNWAGTCFYRGTISSNQLLFYDVDESDYINEAKEDKEKFAQWAKDSELVNMFWKNQKRLKDKDIYSWMKKSPDELRKEIDKLSKTNREIKTSGYDKLAENEEYTLFKIKTYEGAVKLGKGTQWCISSIKEPILVSVSNEVEYNPPSDDNIDDYNEEWLIDVSQDVFDRYGEWFSEDGGIYHIVNEAVTISVKPSFYFESMYGDCEIYCVISKTDKTSPNSKIAKVVYADGDVQYFNANDVMFNDDTTNNVPKSALELFRTINESLKEEKIEIEKDSQGNELTAEQSEFFKNSKVRDENNRLLVVYHGTSKQFDDETFKSPINWFTPDLDYARGFGTWTGKKGFNYQCYLSCSKIFDCGLTDGPIFSLMPIKPYKFSSRFESIFKKLNTNEKLIRNMIEEVANEFDEKENGYKMKIHVLTRSYQFKDLLSGQGYDCMRCVENGNVVTFGVFNSNQIKKIDNKTPTNSTNINESKQDEQRLIDFAGDSLAKRFLSIKKRLKSPENDIYYWLKKTPVELEDRVNEIENTTSKTKQKKIEKTEGAELVVEENGWKVYRIDTYEASCLYGKGTKWCTASIETSDHFNDYKNRGIKLYYFIKNNNKYALALYPQIIDYLEESGIKANYELYDTTDKLITNFNQIKSLNLPEIPGIKLTFETLPTKIENGVLIKVYPYNQGEFVIPNSVTSIGETAFYGCSSLTSITIPSSVTSIGNYAFGSCHSLTSIIIPNSVTKIGNYAFNDCYSLKSITIPNSVTKIGNYAFNFCTSLTSITIPSGVTSIGDFAFSDCISLTSIKIPNSMTKIGSHAFSNCNSLTSITIPDSVTSIDDSAFYYCKSLKSITIPSSVTSIGKWAFYNCKSLKSITIPSSVTSIGNYAFAYCKSLTIYAEAPSKPIGWNAQWNSGDRPVVWNYKNSTGSNNINEAKQDEQNLIDFAGDSLAKRFLSIKNRLKSPENDIYYWLKKDVVELEDKVNDVETTTSKTKQKKIEKTEGAELVVEKNGWKVYRIDTYEASCLYGKGTKWCVASTETSDHFNEYEDKGVVFYYFIKNNEKYALALYPQIVDGLKREGIRANYELYDATDKLITNFNQIKSLNLPEIPGIKLTFETLPTKIENGVLIKVYSYNQGEFVIPDSVTSIGEHAFSFCTSLTSITVPSSVTSIGYRAFASCESLKSITIPSSVTKIGDSAFYNCISLTSITIPSGVTSIGSGAFFNCSSLTSITIPSSVTSIGKWAFYGCSSLTSITIPDSVTSIGNYAFSDCFSLTSITIPSSVTKIGNYAFNDCYSLKSITIPNSVTKIGDDAFSNCLNLSIYAEATSKPTGWDAEWNPDNSPVIWNYKNSTGSNNK